MIVEFGIAALPGARFAPKIAGMDPRTGENHPPGGAPTPGLPHVADGPHPVVDSEHVQHPPRRPAGFVAAAADRIASALMIALAGSALIAVVECGFASLLVWRKIPDEPFPIALAIAGVGKAGITHVLIWAPVMALVAMIGAVSGRPGRGVGQYRHPRTDSDSAAVPDAEPFLIAAFVLLAGLAVIPADLGLAGREGPRWVIGGCAVAGIASFLARLAAGGVLRRFGRKRFRRMMSVAALIGAVLIAASGAVFARSPFFDAGRYRLGAGSTPHTGSTLRERDRSRPNVLWIVLDTVRADRTSIAGDAPTTPFLRTFAERSVNFARAVSNGTWTIASHASMFTGLPVRSHDATYQSLWLDDGHETLAERLRERGYSTALFTNNPLLSRETNLAQGFDTRRVLYHYRHLSRFSIEYLCEMLGVPPFVPWLDGDFGAAMTNQLASAWIDEHLVRGERPFMMLVNYMDAHLPYRVPGRYRRAFMSDAQAARSYALRRSVHDDLVNALDLRFNIEGGDFLSETDRDVLRRQYDAAIRYLDDRTGELINFVKTRGLLDETVVVIVSDHGEYLGGHGMWAHRFSTYEDLAHVVMMLREPGRTTGVRVESPAQPSELFGAIDDATGGGSDRSTVEFSTTSRPARLTISELARLDDPRHERFAVCEYEGADPAILPRLAARNEALLLHRALPQAAVTDGVFKLIEADDHRRELYRLADDPHETRDLLTGVGAPEVAATAESLARRLAEWRNQNPAYRSSRGGGAADADAKLQEILKSLGYAGE